MASNALHSKTSEQAQRLLDQLTTPIAVVQGEVFVYTNTAFCELFDIGASRLRALPLGAFVAMAEVFEPLLQRARAQAGASITARGQRFANASQRSIVADIIVTALLADKSSAPSVIVEIHELPPDAAKTTPPRLSESLRGFAHEVKNPLAGVRGAAQLLKRRLAEPALMQLTDMIIAETDRLGALADRLLHGGVKSHLGVINLHEVAERARALIQAQGHPGLRLDRDYDPSLPNVRGDADRLLQLLLNLMRNAVQAGAARLRVRSRAEHNVLINERPARLAVRLDVIDDGQGVAEELRDTLFLPLVSGRADGSGLGLALVQEIAREHGGAVSHQRTRDSTIFSLLLPIGVDHG